MGSAHDVHQDVEDSKSRTDGLQHGLRASDGADVRGHEQLRVPIVLGLGAGGDHHERSGVAQPGHDSRSLTLAPAGHQCASPGERLADRYGSAQLGVGLLRMMISCVMWSFASVK